MFDQWVEVYELLVDWPRRLEREGPMFRRLFEQTGVRRVLDVACGPGYHAAMFHRWGLEVEGADLSPAMIQRAITLHGQPRGLRWTVRGFQEPVPTPGYFDAAICIGNSLALAGDRPTAAEAVRQMLGAVRPGGLVVIQVLNLCALPEGTTCWQKCLVGLVAGQPRLILKAAHRLGQALLVDLLLVDLGHPQTGPRPTNQPESPLPGTSYDLRLLLEPGRAIPLPCQARSEQLLGFSAEQLQQMAQQAGAERMLLYGGYSADPYQPQSSQDLILVAWRAEKTL